MLGWAVKYHNLCKLFDQSEYVFDVTKKFDSDKIVRTVALMASCCKNESEKIRETLPSLQSDNVYDVISP